jgi:GTP-binding protein HflX
MNALTGADVLVADQLFATLDPTTRRIVLPGGRGATLSDTVGFVSKLPHDLVVAFRSTLEEVADADFAVHVADASSPDVERQVDAVRDVLAEIGAGKVPETLVLNKVDLLDDEGLKQIGNRFPGAAQISALTGEGCDALAEEVAGSLPRPPFEITLLVPFGREDLTARLYREAEIISEEQTPDGTLVHARVGGRELAAVKDLVI